MITITLVALAAVNAVFITSATIVDNRHASALARTLGATPYGVSGGLSAAQLLPALIGAILGIPGGRRPPRRGQRRDRRFATVALPAVVSGSVLIIAAPAIPARLGARRPVMETLQSEYA